jgi:hypothetical protein
MLELRHHFKNDVILVRLRVQSADLALAERVIERGIDLIRRDIETRSGGPVDGEIHTDAIGLLVRGDVTHLRQLAEFRDKFVRPDVQFRYVRVFERVLILRAADTVVHREVLYGLQIEMNAGNLIGALLQP